MTVLDYRSLVTVRRQKGITLIVGLILVGAMATNILVNTHYPEISDAFPFLGPRCARLTAAVMQRLESDPRDTTIPGDH